jgi:hypothetical protein
MNEFLVLLSTSTTLNDDSLTNDFEWTHEWTLLYDAERAEQSPPSRTDPLLLFISSVATERVSISGQRFDLYQRIRCYEMRF